jgi:hypothetical protein
MRTGLDSSLAAAFQSGVLIPFFMGTFQFKTSTQRVWSGVGNLTVDGQTFVGVGSFAEVGAITEGTDVEAKGTYVKLSGIDPVLLGEAMNDIQPGLQAMLWIGAMDVNANIIGSPYQIFGGIIDQPLVDPSDTTVSITLNLESKVIDFSRASNRKYTSADQRSVYPHDSGFDYVEQLNNIALRPWQ